MQEIYARAKSVKLLICDVDGVMTDGRLFFGDDGQEYKAFHSRDGLGIKMLQSTGVKVAVITARTSYVVSHRMKNLNIKYFYQGEENKIIAYEKLCSDLALGPEQIAYIGDDVVDLPVMKQVGFSIAVADAHEVVKQYAHWTTDHIGGHGAVRDVCEILMKSQGTFEKTLNHYL